MPNKDTHNQECAISKGTPILITGASGFIGRYFIEAVKDHFLIYALARRSQRDAGVPPHTNIHWFRTDIGKKKNLALIIDEIIAQGGVDFIFHFAGYYDFTNTDSPEYQRTNVDGTRFLLENAERLKIKRFIFSSSLTVTDFSDPDIVINEQSPTNATIPYARSKKEAEELIRKWSEKFPCTIIRLAAIFSDWCEYGPLYILLKNWLSGSWKATLMPGRGDTALPYLHVHDLNNLLLRIITRHDCLSRLDIMAASRDGCVSQKELFAIASRYFYGTPMALRSIPVWLATIGVGLLEILGGLTGEPPFERVWMLKYIDRRLQVDSTATQRLLDWQPVPRYQITRRMLFLIENMKSNPNLWEERNLAMANKVIQERPGLRIYEVMLEIKQVIVEGHTNHLTDPGNRQRYPHYSTMDRENLKLRAILFYEMLEVVFLNGDRKHILCYANYLARQRSLEGIGLSELSGALQHTAENLKIALLDHPNLKSYHQRIHDEVGLTLQLILDEIEDVYDNQSNTQNPLAASAQEHCLNRPPPG